MGETGITVSDVFTSMSTVFDLLLAQFSTTIETITDNPLFFVPVLVAFGGGLILAGVKIVRRLGVRGVGGRGRRRRRRA